jgi:hypothetical protein
MDSSEYSRSQPIYDSEAGLHEPAKDSRIKAGKLSIGELNNEKIRNSHGPAKRNASAWKPTPDHIEEQRACREKLEIGEYRPKPRPMCKTMKEAEVMLTESIIDNRDWYMLCEAFDMDPKEADPDDVYQNLKVECEEPPIDPEGLHEVLCRLQRDFRRDMRSDQEMYADQEGMHEAIDRW